VQDGSLRRQESCVRFQPLQGRRDQLAVWSVSRTTERCPVGNGGTSSNSPCAPCVKESSAHVMPRIHVRARSNSSRCKSGQGSHTAEPRNEFPQIASSQAHPDSVAAIDGTRARASPANQRRMGHPRLHCEGSPENRGAHIGSEIHMGSEVPEENCGTHIGTEITLVFTSNEAANADGLLHFCYNFPPLSLPCAGGADGDGGARGGRRPECGERAACSEYHGAAVSRSCPA